MNRIKPVLHYNMLKFRILDLNFLGESETIASFVIECNEGIILVESGPHSTFSQLELSLRTIGYKVEDVKHVLLTHIHFDHAGAAWCFAEKGAKIHVHPMGAKHLMSPEKLYNSAKMIYGDKMEELWGQMHSIAENQVVVPEHGVEYILNGVTVKPLFTPGHAVHHIAWEIDKTIFSGDVAGVKIGSGGVVPPCPPPDINIEDWQKSLQILKNANADAIVLTHFGIITEIEQHLDELEVELLAWANWMRPYYDEKTEQSTIIPLFQAFVASRLANKGVSEKDIPKYEKANPAFMSVAGLMRYWHKKLGD